MTSALAFSRKVAARYLWSRRAEAFITIITVISILGVAIGVAVLNITMAVMTGFENELRTRLTATNSHVVVRGIGGRIANWEELEKKISALPGVASVSAFCQEQALLRTDTRATGLLIRGIEPGSAAAKQIAVYEGRASDGSGEDLFAPQQVASTGASGAGEEISLPALVIGHELAQSFGLVRGATVSLLSPQVTSSPFGLVPRFRRFAISGIYHSGLIEYESGLAYMSLADTQNFFKLGDVVSGLEVRVNDVNQSGAIAKIISERFAGHDNGIFAQDWTELNRPLWEAMGLEKRVYFIVLLLIVVMASFSIITTLVMLVLEKRKDIAILKTLGASAKKIAAIFIIHGATIGALGTIAGLGLGALGCFALRVYGFPLDERIFQMSQVPVQIVWYNFALVGVVSFSICCLATIYPALRACKLEPSEVLRYE